MKLTGKAKYDFLIKVYYQEDTNQVGATIKKTENELIQEESLRWVRTQDERFINALIIEWFDSVGIIFWISPHYNHDLGVMNEWAGFNKTGMITESFKSRQQATEQAIITANNIYNAK